MFKLDPRRNIDDQIDAALWACGREEIVAFWLPEGFESKTLDSVAGIPIRCTRYNQGGAIGIWVELAGDGRTGG